MDEGGIDESGIDGAGTAAAPRRLRPLIGQAGEAGDTAASGWRDDLRLFAATWAVGFLFFLLLIA